jgi:hypothetical protein
VKLLHPDVDGCPGVHNSAIISYSSLKSERTLKFKGPI